MKRADTAKASSNFGKKSKILIKLNFRKSQQILRYFYELLKVYETKYTRTRNFGPVARWIIVKRVKDGAYFGNLD